MPAAATRRASTDITLVFCAALQQPGMSAWLAERRRSALLLLSIVIDYDLDYRFMTVARLLE